MKIFRKKTGQSGLSLLELLIAMVLGMIITTAVYVLYVGSLRISEIVIDEKKEINNLRVIKYLLGKDVKETDLNKAVIINKDDPGFRDNQDELVAMALPEAKGPDDTQFQTREKDGMPVWKRLNIYYVLPGTTELRKKTVYPNKGNEINFPIQPDQVRSYCDGRDDKIISYDVVYFNPQALFKINKDKTKQSLGRMDLYLNLFHKNRKGTRDFSRVQFTLISRNSFYEKPGPLHSPIPTPSPPGDAPTTPSDWPDS